jgi:hypothetical protein
MPCELKGDRFDALKLEYENASRVPAALLASFFALALGPGGEPGVSKTGTDGEHSPLPGIDVG